jgi:hypothetical protein
MATVTIRQDSITRLLEELLGRDVTVTAGGASAPHPATLRGLVTDGDVLVAVLGGDLPFAHRSGAALAMIPAGKLDEIDDEPDTDILAIYTEVANVLSRLVNEASPNRVRLDPAMQHDPDALQRIVDQGQPLISCTVGIAGYGSGELGAWWLLEAS